MYAPHRCGCRDRSRGLEKRSVGKWTFTGSKRAAGDSLGIRVLMWEKKEDGCLTGGEEAHRIGRCGNGLSHGTLHAAW